MIRAELEDLRERLNQLVDSPQGGVGSSSEDSTQQVEYNIITQNVYNITTTKSAVCSPQVHTTLMDHDALAMALDLTASQPTTGSTSDNSPTPEAPTKRRRIITGGETHASVGPAERAGEGAQQKAPSQQVICCGFNILDDMNQHFGDEYVDPEVQRDATPSEPPPERPQLATETSTSPPPLVHSYVGPAERVGEGAHFKATGDLL